MIFFFYVHLSGKLLPNTETHMDFLHNEQVTSFHQNENKDKKESCFVSPALAQIGKFCGFFVVQLF